MDVTTIKIEIRKHHVLEGVKVLDLVIETDEENLVKQTQHKESDRAYQNFIKEAIRISKELAYARIE